MSTRKPKAVLAAEFDCKTPLKFYEHCISCPRFDGCPDLALIKEILRLKKKINYNRDHYSGRGDLEGIRHSVDANVFNCLAPLYFFERTRERCANGGRCRESGLLLALLTGNRKLEYSQKVPMEFPRSQLCPQSVETRGS